MSPQRWAPVAGCGIAGSAAVSAPARRPTWPRRSFAPVAPLPPPEPVGSPAGGRARKESGAPRPRPAPTPPAGSSRPALGDRAARFRRGSFSNMSGSLPRRARVARQRLVDYSSRPGRPPPPARHLRFGTVRNRRLRRPQPRAARCLQAAPASGSAAAAGRRGQPGSGPWKVNARLLGELALSANLACPDSGQKNEQRIFPLASFSSAIEGICSFLENTTC